MIRLWDPFAAHDGSMGIWRYCSTWIPFYDFQAYQKTATCLPGSQAATYMLLLDIREHVRWVNQVTGAFTCSTADCSRVFFASVIWTSTLALGFPSRIEPHSHSLWTHLEPGYNRLIRLVTHYWGAIMPRWCKEFDIPVRSRKTLESGFDSRRAFFTLQFIPLSCWSSKGCNMEVCFFGSIAKINWFNSSSMSHETESSSTSDSLSTLRQGILTVDES